VTPPLPLQTGGLLIFRLFGLVFAAVGALHLVKPREMTAYQIRRRTDGEVDGRIEPTKTRLLFTRVVGAFGVVLGLALAAGVIGP
jgi:hypothetical protein